jgi:hypothetical protein
MIARLAVAALGAILFAAAPAYADGGDRHRHNRHHGHGHHQKWHGHHGHGHHGWHHDRYRHHGARIVIWQPAPVYRAYPAPYPVYVPAPAPVVHAPLQAIPLRSYQDTSGRYCREYQRLADIGGQQQEVYGTACMMPDGSWQIVSE